MADGSISIPITELQRLGGEFKAASQQSLETLNRLRQAVDSVEPEWHGVAKERFVQEFRQWEITMRQFGQLLETVGSRLEGFSNNITEMDQKGARRIRRMSSDL